jgi:hypothetical protein
MADCFVALANCDTHTSAMVCATCKTGFSLYTASATSATCVTTIANCKTHGAADCTECSATYTLSSDKKTCAAAAAASNSAIFKAMIGFIMTIFVLLC